MPRSSPDWSPANIEARLLKIKMPKAELASAIALWQLVKAFVKHSERKEEAARARPAKKRRHA